MTETPEKNTNVPWVKPPEGAFQAYANQVHINWSLDDVRLRFAQIGESGEQTGPGSTLNPVNYEKAAITLSWRNAKILQAKLAAVINNYEEVNGEIKLQVTLASNKGT